MPNTIIGRILQIGAIQDFQSRSGNQFRKRELVLDSSTYDQYTGEKRENYPSFTLMQKHVDDVNTFKQGDLVIVSFFISGKAWTKDGVRRYINDIVAYKVETFSPNNGSQPSQNASPSQQSTQVQTTSQQGSNGGQQGYSAAPPFPPQAQGDTDDLPF